MRKGIYLTVLLRLDAQAESPADRDSLLDGLLGMLKAKLSEAGLVAGLSGEIKGSRLQTDVNGQFIRLIARLTGEQEPAENFAELATTELQSLLDALINSAGFPLNVELIEENTNALEELDSDEYHHLN